MENITYSVVAYNDIFIEFLFTDEQAETFENIVSEQPGYWITNFGDHKKIYTLSIEEQKETLENIESIAHKILNEASNLRDIIIVDYEPLIARVFSVKEQLTNEEYQVLSAEVWEYMERNKDRGNLFLGDNRLSIFADKYNFDEVESLIVNTLEMIREEEV